MANKLAQLQQLRALAVRTQGAIAAVAKAASDAITQVANEKADKNHTHTLPTASSTVLGCVKLGDGIESTNGTISPVFRGRGNPADLNDATASGWYAYTAGTANAPTGGAGIVMVASIDGHVWPVQAAYPSVGTVIFIRVYDGKVWSEWTSVNSWRGVVNDLTSTATDQSLSAAMGKALKALVDGKAAASHTHNYAGSSSAGGAANSAITAGKLTDAENSQRKMAFHWLGLTQSPKYVWGSQQTDGEAGTDMYVFPANQLKVQTAAGLGRNGDADFPMIFNWSGQGGQPTWLWGGNDGSNMYVYNPANFSVNYAAAAGNGIDTSGEGYVRFRDGTQICWENVSGTFAVPFVNTNYGVGLTGVNASITTLTGKSVTGFNYSVTGGEGLSSSYIAVGRWK